MSLVIQFSFRVIWFLPFLVLENSRPTFCTENVFHSISFVLLLEITPLSINIVPFYPFNSERFETAILLNKEMKVVGYSVHIYMLFAGWEVRIVKNCDRGLEIEAFS